MESEIIAEADLMIEAPTRSARRGYDRGEVDAFVDATRSRLQAMAARLGQQQSELQRLESENRSFGRMIDVAVSAADELVAEATATAVSTVREAETRAAQVLDIAERRSAEILAAATAEAHERVLVAKADARDALHEERAQIDAELDMVTALLRRAAAERTALDALERELTVRLGDVSAHLASVAADPLGAGEKLLEAAEARARAAEAQSEESSESADGGESPDGPASSAHAVEAEIAAPAAHQDERDQAPHPPTGFQDLTDLDATEADRIDEQSEFFSTEIEDDPSRKWILS